MRRIKVTLLAALVLTSSLLIIGKTEASLGKAKVYIICLSGIPTSDSWVDDFQKVKDGAIDACTLKGKYIEGNVPLAHPKQNVDYPPYYEATPYVVTSWSEYESIITYQTGVIVVNTHGQYLPVPSTYNNNKAAWVDKIAEAMLKRRLTWVHVGGCPFYYVKYENGGTETWGESGFKYLMSYINKGNASCQPPPDKENEWATFSLSGSQQIALSWVYNLSDTQKGPVNEIHYATLGRPLKINDFKEYLIMPLFEYQDYYAGAVIAFVKADARYTIALGAGVYVHIGSRYLYDIDGIQIDADFGRGFVGTAAALWAECMGFNAKLDAKSGGSIWGPYSENASLIVYPSISGVHAVGTDLKITMIFAICGMTQSYYDDVFDFDHVSFFIDEVPGSIWSDVTMRVDLGYSREGYGNGLQLSGLYDENHALLGLLPSGITWLLGAPELLASYPIARTILWGVGGFKLLAQWMQQGYTLNYSGLGNFAPYIYFFYDPVEDVETSADKAYHKFMTLITVELKIPVSGKSGWLILPLSYNITALPNWYAGWGSPTPGLLIAADTLQLVVWFSGAGQNDAGSGGDASDSQSSPTLLSFGYYHGYLGGGDNVDWYSFQVTSTTLPYVLIEMTPPPFVNFDMEVYTPSGVKYGSYNGAGTTESLQFGTQIGLWKIRIYTVSGSGVYSLHLSMKGKREACPFVYVWNGQQFIIDNNILPTSLKSNGTDVEDYYKLEQILVPKYKGALFSLYPLQICEFENEHSYIDQAKLLAVDHSPECKIAVTPNGEIVTYHQPSPPLSCIDNYGNDRLSEIINVDGNVSDPTTYFYGNKDDYLILHFERVNAEYAKLILRSDMKCEDTSAYPPCCINVQVLKDGEWQTVAVIAPREYWATEAVDLSAYINVGQDLVVRLYWTMPHRLDYVGLDTSPPDQIKITEASLIKATHSNQEDVTAKLLFNDQKYAELTPGEQINLTFVLPNKSPNKTRTFIFYTEGHYYTIKE
jgi:hypothetical protein